MTSELARDDPQILHADTIGAAWLAVAGRIVAEGIDSRYDDLPVREISLVTLTVERPDPGDEIIARYVPPGRMSWMQATSPSTRRSRQYQLRGSISYGVAGAAQATQP